MVFLNHAMQPHIGNMGINLSRVQIGVSQHILNYAQIQSVPHQMRGKGVAQAVRADVPDACPA